MGNNMFIRKKDKSFVKIERDEIEYIEKHGRDIIINTKGDNHRVNSTMNKINDRLNGDNFMKVHRSYIINLDKVDNIEDNSLLVGKKVIPVSRSNKPGLLKRLNFFG